MKRQNQVSGVSSGKPMEKGRSAAVTHAALIAPCGMNCRLCMAFARERKPCPGCRFDSASKSKSCMLCRIKNCTKLQGEKIRYCIDCDEFPCERLKHLDKRYRLKYGMSMIENLSCIEQKGIRRFVRCENEKWKCPRCGELLCVHKPQCLSCGRVWHRNLTLTTT